MADRIFGIDVADKQLAGPLSNELWEQHREEILEILNKH